MPSAILAKKMGFPFTLFLHFEVVVENKLKNRRNYSARSLSALSFVQLCRLPESPRRFADADGRIQRSPRTYAEVASLSLGESVRGKPRRPIDTRDRRHPQRSRHHFE